MTTPPPPTSRQIAEMTAYQAAQKAGKSDWRTCPHDYLTSHGRGWECCDCGVGILSIVCPIPLPNITRALELCSANPPSPRAGDSLEGESE